MNGGRGRKGTISSLKREKEREREREREIHEIEKERIFLKKLKSEIYSSRVSGERDREKDMNV